MAARFVSIDRDTPLLLPPNLCDWVPEDHLVHLIVDAVAALDLRQVQVNERGTGSAQYRPGIMPGLLIYSFATGVFGSRRIEQSTHDSVPVRLLTADTHPDHDTICAFRRENQALVAESFVKVLQLAQQLKSWPSGPPKKNAEKGLAANRPRRPRPSRMAKTNTISPTRRAAS